MTKHRNLLAWQVARELVREVYRITKHFPNDERFSLTQQLRRAAVSVAANIAEGMARLGPREAAHGLSMSLGSLAEVDTLMAVAQDQSYVSQAEVDAMTVLQTRAGRLILGLQRSLRAA